MGRLIVVLLAACSNRTAAEPGQDEAGLPPGWLLRLPPAYESWRPQLSAELTALVARSEPLLARWPREADPDRPLEVRVLTPREATREYLDAGWELDSRVPRTFPRLRLAVVPLPRDDRLLRDGARIPQTWLNDLQHEAGHLAALDRPGLDEAPRWFLEGLAEALCVEPPGAQVPGWPRWQDADLWAPSTAEGLQRARARSVRALLAADPTAPTPWQGQPEAQPQGGQAEPPRTLRGRHAGWWPGDGIYLLVPPRGALASIDLLPGALGRPPGPLPEAPRAATPLASWDGATPLRFSLQAGDTGLYPDAGLLIASEGGEARDDRAEVKAADRAASAWLRLRITTSGALGARLERGELPQVMMPLDPAADPTAPRTVELTIQDRALHLRSGSLQQSFPIGPGALAPPFSLRLYAFDSAVRLRLLR